MNRTIRSIPGLTSVRHAAYDPSADPAVRAASLAALTLAAQAPALIREPHHAEAPPLYAGGPGCPPTG